MRKVIFQMAVSVDGFIEGPNGELDWLTGHKESAHSAAFLAHFDTIFYGRKAYERFGVPPSDDQLLPDVLREFPEAVSQMRKYVFSRVRKHVPGNGMVVGEDLEAEVKRIREEEGKSIWFCGGADILKTFAKLDLVDEYVLSVYPVVLKRGKPLFPRAEKPVHLKLVCERKLASGVMRLHYLPASRITHRCYDSRSF